MNYRKLNSLFFTAALIFLTTLITTGEENQKVIRVSLIHASQSKQFSVDKKLQSLKSILKKAAKDYQQFIAEKIIPKEKIILGQKHVIKLSDNMFLEIQLDPLNKDHYPITIRWYTKEKNEEKEIVKAQKHKLRQNSSFLIGKKTFDQAPTAELIAIEFVNHPQP